jgi:hypothetical protein
MSFGPAPWQQTHWDWRAAGNVVCGGAGAGLIVFAALSGSDVTGAVRWLQLVGLGLFCPGGIGGVARCSMCSSITVMDDARGVRRDASVSYRASAFLGRRFRVGGRSARVFVYCQGR